MPDIWTKHPDIVRDLLKEAGFTCGAAPRFLKGRDPAWTCAYDGKSMRGDLYIHHVDTLESGVGELERPTGASVAAVGDTAGLVGLALVLARALGAVVSRRLHRRASSRPAAHRWL